MTHAASVGRDWNDVDETGCGAVTCHIDIAPIIDVNIHLILGMG